MADIMPAEPLGLSEVKTNLRVNGTAEDAAIEDLITDAREFVEKETGLVLVPREVTETAASLGRWIELSAWPVTSITSISYPVVGVMTDLASSAWQVSYKRRPVRILPTEWGWGVAGCEHGHPIQLPVEIVMQAGYADATDIPRAATRAMLMLIAHWYENRQTAEVGVRAAAVEVPFGVTKLIQQLQVARV